MATYKIAYNAVARTILVQEESAGFPPGSVFIGTFDHVSDPDDPLGPDINHVIWHHVRDALYKNGVYSTQLIRILDTPTVPYNALLNASGGYVLNASGGYILKG